MRVMSFHIGIKPRSNVSVKNQCLRVMSFHIGIKQASRTTLPYCRLRVMSFHIGIKLVNNLREDDHRFESYVISYRYKTKVGN